MIEYEKFNINDFVRVQLTEFGRLIHRQHFRKQNSLLPLSVRITYKPPVEDQNGWSKWQLWELMSIFGEHVSLGSAPFFVVIEIQKSTKELAE